MPARLNSVGAKSTKLTSRSSSPPGEIFLRCQMPELVREMHDERNVQTGIVRPALAARHSGAVVGVEEDDGVLGEAGLHRVPRAARRTARPSAVMLS